MTGIMNGKPINFYQSTRAIKAFWWNEPNDLPEKPRQGSGLYTDLSREPSTLNKVGLKPNWRGLHVSPALGVSLLWEVRWCIYFGWSPAPPTNEFSLIKPHQRISRPSSVSIFQRLYKVFRWTTAHLCSAACHKKYRPISIWKRRILLAHLRNSPPFGKGFPIYFSHCSFPSLRNEIGRSRNSGLRIPLY